MDDGFATGFLAGQDSGGNGGGWGGFGEGIWAVIILAMLFGNNGGFGGWGGGGGNCATQADVRAAVDQQTLISKLDNQTYGLADSTYALNNTLTNGFHGVDTNFCNLSHQISDCCCDLKTTMMNNTRDIIDFMVQTKMDALRDENQSLKLKASQSDQNAVLRAAMDANTAELIRRINPEPVPAYTVPAPYAYGYGYGGNCGC